jgi:hypothetical protein
MRLLRFLAVACMVTVGVASLGCGEPTVSEAPAPADKPAVETPAETDSTSETAKKATTGTTPVSLAITGMS